MVPPFRPKGVSVSLRLDAPDHATEVSPPVDARDARDGTEGVGMCYLARRVIEFAWPLAGCARILLERR
jgi:hypothetical protein